MPPTKTLLYLRTLPILLAALLAAAPAGAARYEPQPQQTPTLVPVGTTAKQYLLLGSEPLTFRLLGPGELSGYARAHFAAEETAAKEGRVILMGLPGVPATVNLEFKPSRKGGYADGRDGRPSSGRRLAWQVPEGEHVVEIRGDCPDGADIFVVLYYDGPPQPGVKPAVAAPAKKKSSRSRYSFHQKVGLDFIYDTNFLGNSDDYLADWHAGIDPEKFIMNTEDDLVLAPSIDLEVRRQFFACGQTRLRAKIKHWEYLSNPIKNNMEFNYYLRQYVGKGRSLEFSYFYSPEQYIRQLGDREPYTPAEDPSKVLQFRFTKNVLALTYRHKFNKKLSGTLILESNLRYYNQPFIENDVNCKEVRSVLYWSFHKRWRLQADYCYEFAAARARDTVEETIPTSDDSDGTYHRDLYRLGFRWKPPFLKKIVSQIDLSGLLMLYYYPTDKSLFEDPFHAGRFDKVYKVTFEVRRKLSKDLSAKLGTRYTERTVDSPWPGDITLDKDYTKHRVWVSFTYNL